MEKKVMVCMNGGVFVYDDPKMVEDMAARNDNGIVLDISLCSLEAVAEMAAEYGKHFALWYIDGKPEREISDFKRDYADYIVDLSDDDWWERQVGK